MYGQMGDTATTKRTIVPFPRKNSTSNMIRWILILASQRFCGVSLFMAGAKLSRKSSSSSFISSSSSASFLFLYFPLFLPSDRPEEDDGEVKEGGHL
ncbi:hypothetical protein JZ751_005728 [Albula glossodonta]|uniref:Transmembrane protein n=1 Tax=Albula glossodonta TaxID=121402 RepID=A0A8T2N4A7_9TELE|nr:hypothetical protein JZ751_005728 [Albula glossodonta]